MNVSTSTPSGPLAVGPPVFVGMVGTAVRANYKPGYGHIEQ